MEIIEVEVYPAQARFIADPSRFSAFIGGTGSGKTVAGAVKAIGEIARGDGLGLAVAPTYSMLRDVVLRTFLKFASPAIRSFNRTEMRIECVNGATILFRSADDPDRLRGINAAWVWLDEAALCDKDAWYIAVGRAREGETGGRAWLTSTPKGRNWLYDLVQSGTLSVHRAKTADNPYLPPDFITALQSSYSGAFARQELEGEFVTYEGLVYEQFSRERHVRECEPGDYVVIGLDFGYTNPTAAVVVSVGKHTHVLDELYQRHLTIETLADHLRSLIEQYHVTEVLCDPSEPGAIESLRRAGIPARSAHATRILDGVRDIQSRLAQDRLTISRRCANLVAEFESYVWNETKDAPVKANDHALDALRYALTGAKRAGLILLG